MLVQNLIDLINLEADELLDNDTDNIPYINQAIDFLSFTLAGLGDPETITTVDVINGDNVPSNFVDFIPHNGYPIYISMGKFYLSDYRTSEIKKLKYTTAKAHVSAVTDELPFKDMYAGCLVLIASYLIKKKTYIPVEYCNEDKAFVGELMAAIKAAKGVSS